MIFTNCSLFEGNYKLLVISQYCTGRLWFSPSLLLNGKRGLFSWGVKLPELEFYNYFSPRSEVITHGTTFLIPL